MIALDLDGTLLRTDHTIGVRTFNALRAAHAKGVEIVLASGRMTPAMENAAAQTGLDVYIVSYNGAAVCGRAASGRKRLFHCPLGATVARELYELGRSNRWQINFYHQDLILSQDAAHLRPWIDLYRSRTGSPYRIVERMDDFLHEDPTKILFIMEPERRAAVETDLRERFKSRATVIRTDPEYLEFLHPTTNKGAAVLRLAETLEIDASQIMAVGDGENDIPMLQSAGWGVATANARDICKSAAVAVTENDCDHDAVGEAIERWVL